MRWKFSIDLFIPFLFLPRFSPVFISSEQRICITCFTNYARRIIHAIEGWVVIYEWQPRLKDTSQTGYIPSWDTKGYIPNRWPPNIDSYPGHSSRRYNRCRSSRRNNKISRQTSWRSSCNRTMVYLGNCCTSGVVVPLVLLYLWNCCTSGIVVPLVLLYLWYCCTFGIVVALVLLYIWYCCTSEIVVHLILLYLWYCCTSGIVVPLVLLYLWKLLKYLY